MYDAGTDISIFLRSLSKCEPAMGTHGMTTDYSMVGNQKSNRLTKPKVSTLMATSGLAEKKMGGTVGKQRR